MSILKRIISRIYVNSYIVSRLAIKEYNSKARLPFFLRVLMWRLGFLSSSCVLYNLPKNEYRDYLTDYQENVRAIELNVGYHQYLDNKILFSSLIENDVEVPELYALVMSGVIQPLGKNTGLKTSVDILSFVKDKNLILKPVDSASGSGVVKLEYNNGKFIKNGKEESEENLNIYLKHLHNYIISPVVEQAQYSKSIYPGAVNTVRILTMIDPAMSEPFIAAAAHRFGTDRSAPVDNCNAGGLTANINIETGEMSAGVSTYITPDNRLHWHEKHPDTGAQIKGEKIPRWKEISDKILHLSGNIRFLKYIGWDIVVTDSGFLVLEGNNGPDIKLHQVHKPLLADERVRKFFHHYKVVR